MANVDVSSDLLTASTLQVGEHIGGCRVLRMIGRGGFGEVYEVTRAATGERLALKVQRVMRASDKDRTRSEREAITLQRIVHPNVVRVHDAGVREDDVFWMTMDLLVGRTLRQLLIDAHRLPIAWALRIGASICEGLTAIHQVALHRDLKPENIHFGADQQVRLFDLGAGKVFDATVLTTNWYRTMGTAIYMSPEQFSRPWTVDVRSDLFAVGDILYEMLTGKQPWRPESDEPSWRIGQRILTAPHTPLRELAPAVPAWVAEPIERCLQKSPADRPSSAHELALTLRALSEKYEAEFPSAPITLLNESLPPPIVAASHQFLELVSSPDPYARTASSNPYAMTDEGTTGEGAAPLEALVAKHDPGAPNACKTALEASSVLVRLAAAEYLALIGDASMLPSLHARHAVEESPIVRSQIERTIATLLAGNASTDRAVAVLAPTPPGPLHAYATPQAAQPAIAGPVIEEAPMTVPLPTVPIPKLKRSVPVAVWIAVVVVVMAAIVAAVLLRSP